MIINDFHFVGIAFLPHETNPPLIINADTVLTRAVASQFLQAISRRHFQIMQSHRAIQHAELAKSH